MCTAVWCCELTWDPVYYGPCGFPVSDRPGLHRSVRWWWRTAAKHVCEGVSYSNALKMPGRPGALETSPVSNIQTVEQSWTSTGSDRLTQRVPSTMWNVISWNFRSEFGLAVSPRIPSFDSIFWLSSDPHPRHEALLSRSSDSALRP